MIDRGALDDQLQKLGDTRRWWSMRELRDLPSIMQPDEQIIAMSRGRIARIRMLRRSWLIVVTDRRLICIRTVGRTWRQLEVNGRDITRVTLRVGPFRGRVRVRDAHRTYRLLVPRDDAYRLHLALASIGGSDHRVNSGFAPARVVGRIVDHVMALPAVAFEPPVTKTVAVAPDPAREAQAQARVHELENQVEQLRDQVEFLEQLLKDRSHVLPPT